jgi:hypothetical protein
MPEPTPNSPPAPPNDAWSTQRAALAGGDQTRAQLLESIASPDQLFERLTAKPPEFDWRKAMAGEDADEIKYLERFPDLPTARKSWREADKRINESGRVKIPGENATDADKAEWAKAIGLAEKPDAYEITAAPPAGYQISDGDKAIVGRLQAKLHEALAGGARAPDLMNIATQFYFDESMNAANAAEDRAAEAAVETEAQLKDLWGGQYDANVQWAVAGLKQFFVPSSPDKLDEELDQFLGIPLATGHKLGDHPMILRMFSTVGRQFAEDPFFLKMKGENQGFDPAKRKAEIMALRETNTKLYASPEIQAELDRINAGLARREEQGRAR